jgi:hypothetical protein
MTRYEKSDAQLDAEAQPLEERDLDTAIALHRGPFRDDLSAMIRLHARDGDDAGLGPPFNPVFAGYLSDEFGSLQWNRAWFYLRHRVCRSSHSEHWERPEWYGSLCGRIVHLVIREEYPLTWAMAKLGLTHEGKSRRTLDSGLLIIERRLEVMADDRPESSPRSPAEWMAPAFEHHALDGLHRQHPDNGGCPQCWRRGAAA